MNYARMILLSAAGMFAAAITAAQTPTAEAILDRYVEVTGGKTAYERQTNQILTGSMVFTAQNLTGNLTRYSADPDKEYSIVEIGPLGKIESGVTNGVAWEKSAFLGPRIKSGEERDQALREARFNLPINWRKVFAKAEVTGSEMVNGEECYKLTMYPAHGAPQTEYYSKASGLLLKTVVTAASPMGDVPVEVDYMDYKDFGGVLAPSRSRQKAGQQELMITITSIASNQPIPADRFELPPEIKALLQKSGSK
jgi:hypothetical protein